MNYNIPPKKEESEITVIGTGGGYGECIILKLGEKDWIIVDSCIDPITKKTLALTYLTELGVDIANDVKLILCTHWHDDHVKGMSELLDLSVNADFVMSKVNDKEKFLQLVALDSGKLSKSSNSTTVEFSKCLEIQSKRKKTIKSAFCDRLLYKTSYNNKDFKIISLSPSDLTINEFDMEISTLIKEFGQSNRQIVVNTPNDKSVALLIQLGGENVILGSDLEVGNNAQKGWLHIINHSVSVQGEMSSVFKIPHHGSNNGYNTEIWNKLLHPNPISKITPWNRGKGLPQEDMIQVYKNNTDKLYITSSVSNKKSKNRNLENGLSKFIKSNRPSLEEIKYHFGIIRSRINYSEQNPTWKTELFGEAIKII